MCGKCYIVKLTLIWWAEDFLCILFILWPSFWRQERSNRTGILHSECQVLLKNWNAYFCLYTSYICMRIGVYQNALQIYIWRTQCRLVFFSETEWHFDLINYIVLNGQLFVGCQGKLLLGFACVFFNVYLYIFNHLYINISQVCQWKGEKWSWLQQWLHVFGGEWIVCQLYFSSCWLTVSRSEHHAGNKTNNACKRRFLLFFLEMF